MIIQKMHLGMKTQSFQAIGRFTPWRVVLKDSFSHNPVVRALESNQLRFPIHQVLMCT